MINRSLRRVTLLRARRALWTGRKFLVRECILFDAAIKAQWNNYYGTTLLKLAWLHLLPCPSALCAVLSGSRYALAGGQAESYRDTDDRNQEGTKDTLHETPPFRCKRDGSLTSVFGAKGQHVLSSWRQYLTLHEYKLTSGMTRIVWWISATSIYMLN